MTKWDNLWARPSTMLAMGVEVRPSGWLEELEKEGYLMQGKLEAILKICEEASNPKYIISFDTLELALDNIKVVLGE